MLFKIFNSDVVMLILRIYSGFFMAYYHGLPKLQKFSSLSARFADPLMVGSFTSLSLVIFAELLCSILVMLGFAIRIAVIPLIITMFVAVFIIHAGDPMYKKELAISYLFFYSAIFVGGAGKFSIKLSKYIPNNKITKWLFDI